MSILFVTGDSRAQSNSPVTTLPSYWLYEASGRIDFVLNADLNNNQFEEIVVVTELTQINVLNSASQPQWNFQTNSPIQQLIPISSANEIKQLLVATQESLLLLSPLGILEWEIPLPTTPSTIASIKDKDSNNDQFLVALTNGRLQKYSHQGTLLWEHVGLIEPSTNAIPNLAVADLNNDQTPEIIFTYLTTGGFSRIDLIESNGDSLWERTIAGQIISFNLIPFTSSSWHIAVGTDRGRIYLHDYTGENLWFRTPNKPVVSIQGVILPAGPALLAGTATGTLIAYDRYGQKYWQHHYRATPDHPILAISAFQKPNPKTNGLQLAVTLGAPLESNEPTTILLLDGEGTLINEIPSTTSAKLSRLIDINHDDRIELLLANFGTIELVNPTIEIRKHSQAWDYRLDAQAQTVLTADIDQDLQKEILIGTNDGHLHILRHTRDSQIADIGGILNNLALIETTDSTPPIIAIAHNNSNISLDSEQSFTGWLKLLQADGKLLWEKQHPTSINHLLITPQNSILVSTDDEQLTHYELNGTIIWQISVPGNIQQMIIADANQDGESELIISRNQKTLDQIDLTSSMSRQLAQFTAPINNIHAFNRPGELETPFLIITNDKQVHGLNWRGIELWHRTIPDQPTVSQNAASTVLIGTDSGYILRIDPENNLLWETKLPNPNRITTIYWQDLDDNNQPDIAIGTETGSLFLYNGAGVLWNRLSLASTISDITSIRNIDSQQTELIVVTENGIVQLFRTKPNFPPLLINALTEVAPNQYSISITVLDVEQDVVVVSLELFDEPTNSWIAQGDRQATSGNDSLFWLITPPIDSKQPVRYRLKYNDGSYQGEVIPAAGPIPLFLIPWNPPALLFTSLLLITLLMISYLFFQRFRKGTQLYYQLQQHPKENLLALEQSYNETDGSPDILLNLANDARHNQNLPLANLADGFFLLANRPEAAIPIIQSALEEENEWLTAPIQAKIFRLLHAFLEAPSIVEITLLLPQLIELSAYPETKKIIQSHLLIPPIKSLQDSERVDQADDRLFYLNEGLELLTHLQQNLNQTSRSLLTWHILTPIIHRFIGLCTAEIESLRGRAQLLIQLITKRIIVRENETSITISIENKGRATAENLLIIIQSNPAYTLLDPPDSIPILSPGRTQQLNLAISPNVSDRFRISLTIYYQDRHSPKQIVSFADMVHLLPPTREFSPIPNPYAPGTPLRKKSHLFVGRKDLFSFVNENATQISQQNVMILVGQRRTGKTSALLQLEQHLPESILPVYIDCQSLGVVPGMAAFCHELAWLIGDALTNRGLTINIPELTEWESNPSSMLQRQYIPQVQKMLPPQTTILLIFDEFEAFENLVNDKILPATLFTYLRHLMQHGQGLSFVFVGTKHLEEMSTDYWSVLFNIALYRQIGFLEIDSATELITNPVAPHLIYDDLAINKIHRVTAGHPYFLQLVCYTLVNRANRNKTGYITISDVNSAINEMLQLGEVHFAYLWQRSSYTERAILTTVAHLMDAELPFHPSDAVKHLHDYGVELHPASVTSAFNRLVERDIMRKINDGVNSLYEIKIGLVNLWIAQNKSLNQLYETTTQI